MRITDLAKVRALLTVTAGEDEEQILKLAADSGALLSGHFRLQAGHHAPYFLRFGQLAYRDEASSVLARAFATRGFATAAADLVVVGAETSARYLAIALSKLLGASVALAEVDSLRRPKDTLKTGTVVGAQHVIVATDVLTTGASIRPLVELARKAVGAERTTLLAFASQGSTRPKDVIASLGVTGHVLTSATWTSFLETDCQLCREGKELLPAFEFN